MREAAVLLEIKSEHQVPGEEAHTVTFSAPGTLFYRGDGICILYRETLDRSGEAGAQEEDTDCMLLLSADSMRLVKEGAAHTDMYFRAGVDTEAVYQTRFGQIPMTVHTQKLTLPRYGEGQRPLQHEEVQHQLWYGEGQRPFQIEVSYRLLSDGRALTACRMQITICFCEGK